jgi:hypothetical protein
VTRWGGVQVTKATYSSRIYCKLGLRKRAAACAFNMGLTATQSTDWRCVLQATARYSVSCVHMEIDNSSVGNRRAALGSPARGRTRRRLGVAKASRDGVLGLQGCSPGCHIAAIHDTGRSTTRRPGKGGCQDHSAGNGRVCFCSSGLATAMAQVHASRANQ